MTNSIKTKTSLLIAGAMLFAGAGLAGCATGQKTDSGDRIYSFWPQFPADPRVQFIDSYQISSDVAPEASALESLIYGEERGALPIAKPYGLEMHDGKIYVCDTQNGSVVILDIVKQQTRVIGVGGSARLESPTDVAIAPDGLIYVSDAARGIIAVFDQNERHIRTFGYEGFRPTGIALAGNELFVCDFTSQQVQVLDRTTGERLRAFGEKGDQPGQFVRPLGIATDIDGNVYVTDVIQCVVQKFSPQGELLLRFGTIGDVIGAFVRPKHISVDRDGIIYVVDAGFANVQMFNQEGQVLMFFGIAGPHPGSMKLPAGICITEPDLRLYRDLIHPGFNAERLILVTNQFGRHKVSLYALGELREGYTAADLAVSGAEMRAGVQDDVVIDPLTGMPVEELTLDDETGSENQGTDPGDGEE